MAAKAKKIAPLLIAQNHHLRMDATTP